MDGLHSSGTGKLIILQIRFFFTPWEFFTSVIANGLSLDYSESKSPQVCRTLLSILAVLNNAVLLLFSTRPLISKSSRPFNNSSVTVKRALITIGIINTFMFHSFFSIPLQGRGIYPSFHFISILLCGQPGQQSPRFCKFSYFFCYWLLLDLVVLFRTLLNILTDLNNAEVSMVSIIPSIPILFQSPFWSFACCFKRSNYNWCHHYPHVPHFLLVHCHGPILHLMRFFFLFLFIHLFIYHIFIYHIPDNWWGCVVVEWYPRGRKRPLGRPPQW